MNATIPPQMIANTVTNQQDLLEQSARRLLSETGATQALSTVGKVQIHGALQLRTMVRPEIDLFIGISGMPAIENVAAILTKLNQCIAIRDVHIINQVNFPPRFAFPESISIDIVCMWEGVEWKLDIALVPTNRLSEAMSLNTHLLAKMTELQRQDIVEIKQQAFKSPHYRRQNWAYVREGGFFYSRDVYLAVVNGKANSYDEFCEVLKSTRNISL